MNTSLKASDLEYKNPPRLSEDAVSELLSIRDVKDGRDRSELFKKFHEKYYSEIKTREEAQLLNISNFQKLAEMNRAGYSHREVIRRILGTYDGMPGFFFRRSIDVPEKKKWHMAVDPQAFVMICRQAEAQLLVNESELAIEGVAV